MKTEKGHAPRENAPVIAGLEPPALIDATEGDSQLMQNLRAHYAGKQFEFGWASLCKMTVPDGLEGMTVLDIGCRRGRGVYKLSERVGNTGRAIGLDWSRPYLEEARDWSAHAANKTGLTCNNMQFILGFPEALDAAGLSDASIDMVWVNSVINLTFDRQATLREIARVLRPGGALVCETVTADVPRDPDVVTQAVAIGNSVQAAPTASDFERELREAGFASPECIESHEVAPDAGFKPGYSVPVVESCEQASFTAQVLVARIPVR